MSKQTDLINIPDAITVDGSNNVGIGTSSPSAKLDIRSTGGTWDKGLLLQNASGGNFGTLFTTASNLHYGTAGTHIFGSYDGSSERIRIDSDGLKFHGDTAAANALNDYEEGTWTAVDGSGNAYNAGANATYTKIGRIVYINFDISATASTSGHQIAGLPFTASPTSVTANWSVYGGYSTSNADLWGHVNASTNVIGMFVGHVSHTLNGRWIGAGFYYTEQ